MRSFLLSLVLCAFASTSVSAEERILFAFDDHSIPWHHNLKVTLVPAEKHPGNPVLRRGAPNAPDHGHAILYGTVIKDGDTFKMWYLAMFETKIERGQAPGMWRPMCYAESKDGVTWSKPELGLVEFNGDKKNNICLIEGTPFSLTRVNDFLSVLHEPEDPDPSRRYKAVYIAHVPIDDIRGGLSAIGAKEKTPCVMIAATSADGKRWKVVGDRPMGGERFEASSLYRFGNFYYSTGQLLSPWAWLPDGRPAGRVMLSYRSSDFDTWSRAKAFSFARPGQLISTPVDGQQTHMGAGMWNRGNVLVGLYGMWQDGPKERPPGSFRLSGTHIDLGLIVSNDGIHFREPVADFKVISRGNAGEWDDIALLQGHAFVNDGDKTLIWYSHWDTNAKMRSMEIGLATLRRDGFGYLSAKEDDNDSHFVTATTTLTRGTRLRINVEGVNAAMPLKVELLDDRDRAMRDYSGENAATVSANGTGIDVEWPRVRERTLPANRPVSVKVSFPTGSGARVYALYFSK